MAEPIRYKVFVNAIFYAHNEQFMPGTTYWVVPEIYNGTLPDGRAFKDLCSHAEPEYPVTPT